MRIVVIILLCSWFSGGYCIKYRDDEHDCALVNNFVAKYTRMLKAIPLSILPVNRFCSNETFAQEYKEAVEFFHNATLDKTCRQMNFQRNRLNVIQTMYDQMTYIWSSAHCQDCVDNKNETVKFFRLANDLDACINQNMLRPCESCAYNYTTVQDYYTALDKARKGSICFDIEDRMNQTRHAWSATYNCCKDKQRSQNAFISIASVICSLPVIFYALMYFITVRKETRELAIGGPVLDDSATAASESQRDRSGSLQQADEIQQVEPKLNNLDRPTTGSLIDVDSKDGESTVDPNLDQTYSEKKIAKNSEDEDFDDYDSILGGPRRSLLD